MLGSRTAGLVLLGAQLLSSLTVGFLHFHGGNIRLPPVLQTPSKDAFVESVRGAAAGMIGICAFVVAFSALAALLDAFGVFRLLTGVLASFFPALGERFFQRRSLGCLKSQTVASPRPGCTPSRDLCSARSWFRFPP